jgi:hypothetical protein
VLTRLIELRATDVDAGHVSRRSDHFGKHLRHGANAAAEIGDAHAWGKSCLQQNPSAGGCIQMVKRMEATDGRLACRERIHAVG